MAACASMEEFDIRVKQIRKSYEETSYMIFDAVVLEWRPRKKEWTESKQTITCIGYFYGLVENDHLHVQAEEFDDPVYGPQWQIYLSERVQPGTELELVKFLTSMKGIGPKHAGLLVQELGLDVISRIMKDPSVLNCLGLPQPAKDSLYRAIVENQMYEQILMFLRLHSVPPRYATAVYKKYGVSAIEKIRDNPYSLYLDGVLDFPAAERLDRELGENTKKIYRTTASVLACLRHDTESLGNLYIARSQMAGELHKFLLRSTQNPSLGEGITENDIDEAILSLVNDNSVIVDGSVDKDAAVYLAPYYYAERRTAARIYALSTAPKQFCASETEVKQAIADVQDETRFHLATEQADAIKTGLTSPISILTGGPGTGKTQTLTMLIKTAKKLSPKADIRLCAPTGKAAIRVQELTNMRAYTIHRMIGYPRSVLGEDELVCDIVIADEFSMSDIQLCAWLFTAVSEGARLIIVGDHEQLPSVGPGLVLRDMIDSSVVPVTRLRKIFRQASSGNIVVNAHTIINAPLDKPASFTYSTAPGGDFYFLEAQTQSVIMKKVKASVQRMLAEGFPIDQLEVLSPVHGGLIGTDNLNIVLQELLNPGGPGYLLSHGIELRVQDKVIQTANNYDLEVFNGETGVVKAIAYAPTRAVQIAFPNRDVWYDAAQAEDLALAYAITTHRAQGSEFQAVIIPIHETLLFNYNRNLLYTAITRAKKRVVLVGTKTALEAAAKKVGAIQRNSNLIVRIQTLFLAA